MKWKEYPIPELHTTNKLLKYHRSLIIKLSLGVLPIRVESSRYEKVPFAKKTCPSCKGNTVETKEHFLFHCLLYKTERVQVMLTKADQNWVEICLKPFSFGKLVHKMWEMRWGFLVREMEVKEAQFRENWLAQQSHAMQATAALVGAEALKRSY